VSRQFIKGFVAAIAIGGAAVSSNAAWSNTAEPVGGRAYATRAEFDQAFADAAAASRTGNTPANRERLRNVGWKRLNAPVAAK
jgi:hypothetical protein